MKVGVLGCGIVGLWTAHILQNKGYEVKIYSSREPLGTTSAVAASVLTPFLPWEHSQDIFRDQSRWASETLGYLKSLSIFPRSCQYIDVFEFGKDEYLEDGFHIDKLSHLDFSDFRKLSLSKEYHGNNFAIGYNCYLCEPEILMTWLEAKLEREGVDFNLVTLNGVEDLEKIPESFLFNCLGHNNIFEDKEAYPVFGQSMIINKPNDDGPYFGIGAGDHAIFRHRNGFYLGSYFIHSDDSISPRKEFFEASIDFAKNVYPDLCASIGIQPPHIELQHIQRVQSGTRPFRVSGTRIKYEVIGNKNIMHNVGHGAHGWTIGYGTALEAVELAIQKIWEDKIAKHEPVQLCFTNAEVANLGTDTSIWKIAKISDLEYCAEMMSGTPPWVDLGFTKEQCLESLSRVDMDVYASKSPIDEIIGFIACMEAGIGAEPLLEYICVTKHYRSMGIGTKLVDFFENLLFPKDSNLYLFVSDINPRARKLYEKLGYKVVGTLPNYNLDHQTEYLMRKSRAPKQDVRL